MTMTFITHKWSLLLAIALAAIASGCRANSVSDAPGGESTPSSAIPETELTATPEPGSPAVKPEEPDPSDPAAQTAGSVEPPANCDDPQTQLEMNLCAKAWFDEADAQLNQVYQDLKATLSADKKSDLIAAELAWLNFRDANCEFETSQAEGGSIQPTLHFNCLAELTRDRTAELQQPIQATLSYEQADRQLNELYQDFQSILADPNQAALTTTQLNWIKYRDANCAYEQGDGDDCLARVTQQRTQQLEAQLNRWRL